MPATAKAAVFKVGTVGDTTLSAGAPGSATGTVTATADHPFRVPDLEGWRGAGPLTPGQWLRTGSGTLLYGPGSRDGHRLGHVLSHTVPIPGKDVRGIWDLGSNDLHTILRVIDEAWLLRSGGPDRMFIDDNRPDYINYLVEMDRAVGTRGERYIMIIVRNDNEFITAFPQKDPTFTKDVI